MQSKAVIFSVAALVFSSAACCADAPSPALPPPFTQALTLGGAYYISGTIAQDPTTKMAPSNIDLETHMVLDAVKKTLADAGLGMDDLVSVTVYCTDLSLYDGFNVVYRTYFHGKFPTRAFIGVNQLVRGAHFEIQAIAAIKR